MLAITYWPITLTIFGLLILKWKWDWIKEKQKQNRIRKEQEKLRKEAERIRKEQEEAWLKSEQERKEREAIKEKQFWENFWKKYNKTTIEQPALPDKTKKKRKSKAGFKGAHQKGRHKNPNDEYEKEWEEYKKKFDISKDEIEKYYKILELDPSATVKQIKSKFRELVLKYHPDKHGDKQYAARKFKEIFEARRIILEALGAIIA